MDHTVEGGGIDEELIVFIVLQTRPDQSRCDGDVDSFSKPTFHSQWCSILASFIAFP